MPRRIVIAAVAAIGIALLTSAPLSAVGTPALPCWLGKPPNLPEPQPITVDQATIDRATAILNELAQGTFDRSQLAPQLQSNSMATFFSLGATLVGGLGPMQTMFPFEQRITAAETSTYFRVRFPKETLTWVVATDAQNQIAGLSLRRTLACKIFNIATSPPQF